MKLIYVLDPMCSWCWAFRSELEAFRANHPELEMELILGGLAPDSDEPMPEEQRAYIEQIWHRIAKQTGASFNFDFWRRNTPRRSTYPACRAVIAAQQLDGAGSKMAEAIQLGYYQRALNPSDRSVLTDLAVDIGLPREAFEAALSSSKTETEFRQGLAKVTQFGISGFPALLLEKGSAYYPLALGYTQCAKIEQRFQQLRLN